MLGAKPPSPGSGTAGGAAHIHGHRWWAAPLLASVLLSSLLISASLFSSSRALLLSFSPLPSAASTEPLFVQAKLRQQMRAEERSPRAVVPRIAYLVSGSAGDGAALRRTLRHKFSKIGWFNHGGDDISILGSGLRGNISRNVPRPPSREDKKLVKQEAQGSAPPPPLTEDRPLLFGTLQS